ncbi:MAG TPA: UDP-glucuronic acid decarboxylase family protein [Caulobacteraceae bacterium]|nr:UDP-glucuronic acid decarboxylase family protein [Caulobacteraceae bacterium]
MANKRGARALVAGGAGFLGSHLSESLIADGIEVVCLDNFQTGDWENLRRLQRSSKFDVVEADIVNPLPASILKTKFDFIYNMACAASPPLYQLDPEHTLMTSVLGTRHLLHLAADTGARFLQASTSEVYGDPNIHPQPESYWGNVSCTGPRACYDEGKRAAETLIFDYDRLGKALVRVVRIFNTYGPRLSASDGRVVSNFVSQALNGDDITIYGDGKQTRSFCYVDDLVDGLNRLIRYDGSQPGPVNIGNPIELTLHELVDVILELTGSSSEIVYRPLPVDDPKRRKPDISKAKALLDWEPRTSLEMGLRATIEWFEEGSARRQPVKETGALLSA